MPSSRPHAAAAAVARSVLREPMITRWPAIANRRARPRPSSPVPPKMPMLSRATSGRESPSWCCAIRRSCHDVPARLATAQGYLAGTGELSWDFRHHRAMDANQVAALAELLAPTGWLERTRALGRALRRTTTRSPGGLLVVGTPGDDPWHVAAHLDEESR